MKKAASSSRTPAVHVVPRGRAFAVLMTGAMRALSTGLSQRVAWSQAKALADETGTLAYLHDHGGRIVLAYAAVPDIVSINREAGLAITNIGDRIPITNWFDFEGDDCSAEDAIAAVAGPDRNGLWYSIDLSAFEPPRLS